MYIYFVFVLTLNLHAITICIFFVYFRDKKKQYIDEMEEMLEKVWK